MTNKFPGPCTACGASVAPGAGSIKKVGRRWAVTHAACIENHPDFEPAVKRLPRFARRTGSYEVRTSGGTFYRNYAGRCEDAPCCGCCTF